MMVTRVHRDKSVLKVQQKVLNFSSDLLSKRNEQKNLEKMGAHKLPTLQRLDATQQFSRDHEEPVRVVCQSSTNSS